VKQHIGSTMAKSLDATARFDDSFLSHMVRDFFFVLLVVIIAELGLRFFIVWYDFHNESRRATELAANRLATDVKSIMLNSGGPVAARTVYPIVTPSPSSHRNLPSMQLGMYSILKLKVLPRNGRRDNTTKFVWNWRPSNSASVVTSVRNLETCWVR